MDKKVVEEIESLSAVRRMRQYVVTMKQALQDSPEFRNLGLPEEHANRFATIHAMMLYKQQLVNEGTQMQRYIDEAVAEYKRKLEPENSS